MTAPSSVQHSGTVDRGLACLTLFFSAPLENYFKTIISNWQFQISVCANKVGNIKCPNILWVFCQTDKHVRKSYSIKRCKLDTQQQIAVAERRWINTRATTKLWGLDLVPEEGPCAKEGCTAALQSYQSAETGIKERAHSHMWTWLHCRQCYFKMANVVSSTGGGVTYPSILQGAS